MTSPSRPATDELMSVKQAAAELQISVRQVKHLMTAQRAVVNGRVYPFRARRMPTMGQPVDKLGRPRMGQRKVYACDVAAVKAAIHGSTEGGES